MNIVFIACLLGQNQDIIFDQAVILDSHDLIHESYFLFEQGLCFIVLFNFQMHL